MKKIMLIVIFLLATGCSVEIKKEYYPDGKLKAEMRFKRGRLEGISRGFYASGKLKVKAYFENGKRLTTTCYDENEKTIACPKMREDGIDEQ